MSDIKLSYFNARGRAETARLILAHAGTGRLELDSWPRVVTRGPLHRPEAHPRAVHRSEDPAPVRPAACGQDRRRGRLPVHRHRQVCTLSCLGLVMVTLQWQMSREPLRSGRPDQPGGGPGGRDRGRGGGPGGEAGGCHEGDGRGPENREDPWLHVRSHTWHSGT